MPRSLFNEGTAWVDPRGKLSSVLWRGTEPISNLIAEAREAKKRTGLYTQIRLPGRESSSHVYASSGLQAAGSLLFERLRWAIIGPLSRIREGELSFILSSGGRPSVYVP